MTTFQTYTIAYVGNVFLAVVPDGEDIDAAVGAVEDHAGEEFPDYRVEEGCILTNRLASDDHVLFSSPGGCCGFIIVREGDADVTYEYAVRS
jgi:hypothetical protein